MTPTKRQSLPDFSPRAITIFPDPISKEATNPIISNILFSNTNNLVVKLQIDLLVTIPPFFRDTVLQKQHQLLQPRLAIIHLSQHDPEIPHFRNHHNILVRPHNQLFDASQNGSFFNFIAKGPSFSQANFLFISPVATTTLEVNLEDNGITLPSRST